ncbi:Brix-domain-containing protein, partial [Ramicandelaber brevisporus]
MGRRRKTRTHVRPPKGGVDPNSEDGLDATGAPVVKVPKSFVVRLGSIGTVGRSLSTLVQDVRKIMEPNTASRLKERAANKLKDYVHIAGPLGVTHLLLFSRTDAGVNFKIGRMPRGPTLTFRVNEYVLSKDIHAIQRNPKSPGTEFRSPCLLILNGFVSSTAANQDEDDINHADQNTLKLMTTMFQNMFPSINIAKMKLSDVRRVVLINRDPATGVITIRHYLITVKAVGISRGIKRLIVTQHIPNLGNLNDISDFVRKEAFASESDIEDIDDPVGGNDYRKIELTESYLGRAEQPQTQLEQRAIKLVEIGPRLDMSLVKIEDGLLEGNVLYHAIVRKSAEQVAATEKQRKKRAQEVARRRAEQEKNVQRKKDAQEEHRRITTEGGKKGASKESDDEHGSDMDDDQDDYEEDDDDDNIGDQDLYDDDEEEVDDSDSDDEEPRQSAP